MPAIVPIQIRNGTAAQWTAANPVLLLGERGIETDTGKEKSGDGVTAWNTLAYIGSTGAATQVKQQVTNSTGATLTKGSAVYINGANGTNVTVALAQADAESTSSKTLGLLEENIANNGTGYVILEGALAGLNTTAATNEGDPVWLSPTVAGGLVYGIVNRPLAPYHLVYMGVVSRKNANNGEIFIKVQNGYELEELHNVAITSPVNWNIIRYDSVTSLWKNDVLPSGGTVTSVAALTLGTTGTDVSSTVADDTTTPVITLNLPNASATARGALTAADWSTFNEKQSALTLGTGVQTFLATPTSANLSAAVTDETGTGALVFANSPTLVTPVLGTPASGNLSNCKNYPVASTTVSGTVKVDGTSITINGSGVISGASTYILPTASTSVLGGVKVDGTTVTINGSGVISASGGSSSNVLNGGIALSSDNDIQFITQVIDGGSSSSAYYSKVNGGTA